MIYICDAIMGSGKSTAAINYMNEHPDRKFVYITPYLEEASRIRKGCPKLHFREPSNRIPECGFSKVRHTKKLLEEHENVATTHQAFTCYDDETLQIIRDGEYTLLIDEDVSILETADLSVSDIELLVRGGLLERSGESYTVVDGDCCSWYRGGAFSNFLKTAKMRRIFTVRADEGGDQVALWSLPPELITSFRDTIVMTYMFECQDINLLLRMNRIEHMPVRVVRCGDGAYRFASSGMWMPEYAERLGSMVHIVDDESLNSVGNGDYSMSASWYARSAANQRAAKSALGKFFASEIGGKATDRMWSTYKAYESKLSGRGYTKRFVPFNAKATNEYRGRTVLAYMVNLYSSVSSKALLRRLGIDADDDLFATSAMVQWLWRSGIRDGKEITVYIPSRRMRDLLRKWIDCVELEYRRVKASSEEVKLLE